jgi:hypothetical protein
VGSVDRFLQFSFCACMLANIPCGAHRPFATDDAGTVAQGTFELETAADYWNEEAAFGMCFKHGLTERMDIGVELGRCMLPEDERGFDGAALGLKFALIPDLFSASFSGQFGDPGYGASLIVSKAIGIFCVHGNLGGSVDVSADDADMTYGLAGVFEVRRAKTGAEIGGTHEGLDWWQAGIQFSLTDWMAIDAGVGGNFEHDIDMAATTGLWFTFPLNKSTEEKGE